MGPSCMKDDAILVGAYTCAICRKLADRLSKIEQTVENLHNINSDLIKMLEAKELECSQLRQLLAQKSNSENSPAQTTEKNTETIVINTQSKPIPAPRVSLKNKIPKAKVTVLGNSMVRNSGSLLTNHLRDKKYLCLFNFWIVY